MGLVLFYLSIWGIIFALPVLVLLCIPNNKKLIFWFLAAFVIYYIGLFFKWSPNAAILFASASLPIFFLKYLAALQKIKGHRITAIVLPLLGSPLWLIIFLVISSSNTVKKHMEEPTQNITIKKHVFLDNIDYVIPEAFLMANGVEGKLIHLDMMWPSFSPLTSKDYSFRVREKKQIINLTAESPSVGVTLKIRSKKGEGGDHPRKPTGRQFDLDTYDLSDGDKLYISGDNGGHIDAVIMCSDVWCNHYFNDDQLTYEADYSGAYLSDWKATQQKIQTLFQGFKEQAKEKSPK